jgi:hypothetical protein
MKKMRLIGLAALTALWAVLTLCAWFGPAKEISETERRKLAQFPELSGEEQTERYRYICAELWKMFFSGD